MRERQAGPHCHIAHDNILRMMEFLRLSGGRDRHRSDRDAKALRAVSRKKTDRSDSA
jgi:hypothetical protein